jgi:hypothetical protein
MAMLQTPPMSQDGNQRSRGCRTHTTIQTGENTAASIVLAGSVVAEKAMTASRPVTVW